MKCVKCGTENLNGEYCKVCGTRLNENVNYNRPAVSKRSRGLALLFAWIGWGAMQAYLGDVDGAKKRLLFGIKSALLCCVFVGIPMLLYFMYLCIADMAKAAFSHNLYDADGNILVWGKNK